MPGESGNISTHEQIPAGIIQALLADRQIGLVNQSVESR
jgi:hypothetical protein